MINVDNIVEQNLPNVANKPWLAKPVTASLKKLLHEQEMQAFAEQFSHLTGLSFVEKVLEYFNVSFVVRDDEKDNIPSHGAAVIIANHPIGSLDGLALIKLISEQRRDVKVVVNSLLMQLEPLQPLLLPVNNMGGATPKENLQAIHQHLKNQGIIIVFPAGEVSRLSPIGVRDGKWQGGFLRFAKAAQAPIIPIFIEAKNSATFYSMSMLAKPLSTLLLVNEMFKQKQNTISLQIGEQIPFSAYSSEQIASKTLVKLFKKHLYKLKTNKKLVFKTEAPIAQVEDRKVLKHAINQAELLGQTPDGKKIYLHHAVEDDVILREIGVLREIAFRAVGEGSSLRRDLDKFDLNYMHLILWDDDALEIAGAYRLADTQKLIQQHGLKALYSYTLFDYSNAMQAYLTQGLELGRSFVQPRYWGKRSLDYLWFGIGALLQRYPNFRYLFGPVSISNSMPQAAKELMVYFYRLYFGQSQHIATSRSPFVLPSATINQLQQQFVGNDYKKDFTTLKAMLANMGTSVPTLYKQYTELTEAGGVQFFDFGVDADFNHCIDGLVLVDITKLKAKKKARYLS